MAELARHIEILLLDNDCVIVPGFGGFMAHHACSVYSETEALFLPPSRSTGFNPALTINDSLLAQSYVEAYDISYPEALRCIEDDVREVKQNIANDGFYEFINVGTLTSNEEGNYEFHPLESGLLTPSLYALNSFEMAKLPKAVKTASENKVLPIVETVEVDAEKEEEEAPMFISVSVQAVRRALIAAAVFLLLFLVSIPVGDGLRYNLSTCSIDSGILTRLMPGVEVNGSLPDFTVSAPENTVTEDAPVKPVPEEKVEKKSDYYVVVLASHVSKANSEAFATSLRSKGVADVDILTKGARKVVCGNYENESEAYNRLRKLTSDGIIADGWVLRVRQ